MLTHDKISRIKCHIYVDFFIIFIEIGKDLVGRNKVGTMNICKNTRGSIATEVFNSKCLQTNRDYSLVGSLDNISVPSWLILFSQTDALNLTTINESLECG